MLKDDQVTQHEWRKNQAKTVADWGRRLLRALSNWDDFVSSDIEKNNGIISLKRYKRLKIVLAEVKDAAQKTKDIDDKAGKSVANKTQHDKSLAYCKDVVKWAEKKSKEMQQKEDAYIKTYTAFSEVVKKAKKIEKEFLFVKNFTGDKDQLVKVEEIARKKFAGIFPKKSPKSVLHPADISAANQSMKEIVEINKSVLAFIRKKREAM